MERRNDRRARGGQGNGGNRGGGRENPRREARRVAAEQHTDEVATRLAKDIARSLEGVVRYEGAPKTEVAEACVPAVTVEATDAVAAILEHGRGYAQFCDLAVLDFASFVNPGGGYIRGGLAQEEALCTESYLYNVLNEQRDWYGENRRRNINCELYRDRALMVPAVRFERGKMHAYADVIVAAAPNAQRARADYHVAEDTLAAAMRDRIRFVLSIIDALGREKAVLGAYGCGVFGWDAEQVAELFREELASGVHGVKEVVFAIPRTRYDDNLAKFEHAFSAFPEAPATSYAEAAREAAARAAAEESAREAQADDDEDEDDWRKYL
ncbi:TIGR02452 family protein [[Collinsella] massiliensis]|uniref:TIGR02452 family protein n=1 Tax=[Collinsella] massiliensis TaxID=1232426 RepID=A0A1Y3XSY6_9ACTN|nr:TIGR02452 family protein [[Collinsella] massiliensis]